MKKLAIITTHPIQYNAPLFALLQERKNISIKVFYTWGEKVLNNKFDPGFGKNIEWDIPLLDSYDHCFVENSSSDPGSHHFNGIDNPRLIDDIKEWRADAVLVYGWNFKSHLKVLRYFKGKNTLFFRGDSTLIDENGGSWLKNYFRKIWLRWIYRNIDFALYAGNANKAYFKKMGLKEAQLKHVPHSIDNNRFAKIAISPMRQQLGISTNDIVFLSAGKLEPKKNPMLLVRAFSKADMHNTKLVITGNGVLENKLKDYVDTLPAPVKSRIIFLDFINQANMPQLYQAADIFVLPSQGPGETWGLSVNEAMAAGCAVLVSDKCGCAYDLVQNGKNGYVFASGDESILAENIRTIASDNKELASMKDMSKKIIASWSLENTAMAIEIEVNKSAI